MEASGIGLSGDDHAGVDGGEAEPGDNTDSDVRQPAVASTLESTPKADSHSIDDTSEVARPALDFNTIFRSL